MYHEAPGLSLPPSVRNGASRVSNQIVKPPSRGKRNKYISKILEERYTFAKAIDTNFNKKDRKVKAARINVKPPCTWIYWFTNTAKNAQGFA